MKRTPATQAKIATAENVSLVKKLSIPLEKIRCLNLIMEVISLGGGGGTYFPGPTDIDRLEDIARKEIREKKPPKPRRRVFLSFRGRDIDLVNLFRGQAKKESTDLDFIDFSLQVPFKSENAEYIQRGIRERIENSSVTIVLIGKTTYRSAWVDWEIRESLRLDKGVIAVKLKEDSSIRTPRALNEHGIEPLPWDQRGISQAIQEAAESG